MKIIKIITVLILIICSLFYQPTSINGAEKYLCEGREPFLLNSTMPLGRDGGPYTFTFTQNISNGIQYRLYYNEKFYLLPTQPIFRDYFSDVVTANNNQVTLTVKFQKDLRIDIKQQIETTMFKLQYWSGSQWRLQYECKVQTTGGGVNTIQKGFESCLLSAKYDKNTSDVQISGINIPNQYKYALQLDQSGAFINTGHIDIPSVTKGSFTQSIGRHPKGTTILIKLMTENPLTSTGCNLAYVVGENFFNGLRNVEKCPVNGEVDAGLITALGCVPIKPNLLIAWVLSNAIILGGGIAFLMMIFGAFQIIISGGDPEKINGGKEVLTSAIAGLLMIIFSVVLLKIIGYDILRIPGIGGN